MFSGLSHLRGVLSLLYLATNTVFWCIFLFSATLLRLLMPFKSWRAFCGKITVFIAENWIFCNNVGLILAGKTEFDLKGIEELDRNSWYLVISNHQTWVDIPVLQKVFYHQIPFLKFFLKKELIWVPVLGLAWWALDFPFMKRYSKDFLKKHPKLKGKDMEITRKACEKFRDMPVSVMNFTEGTRFTPAKHARQRSPFNHLLRPKAGGIGFVMSAMGEHLSYVLDVTISYPQGVPSIWDLLCGKVKKVHVNVEKIPVSEEIVGNYMEDKAYRIRFQAWLNERWKEKSLILEQSLNTEIKN